MSLFDTHDNDSLLKSELTRINSKPYTPIVLYAPPASGKTYFKQSCWGLPTLDSDDIYFYFKNRYFPTEENVSKVANISESLAGWALLVELINTHSILVVTNLHNQFLVQAARCGCVIIGYLPSYDIWIKRAKQRNVDITLYTKWYRDTLKNKGTKYDLVNVWVDNLDEISWMLASRIYCGFGRSNFLKRDSEGTFEGTTSASCIRAGIAHICASFNKNYVALGVEQTELLQLGGLGKSSFCFGNFKVDQIDVSDVSDNPIKLQECDPDKFNLLIKTLCFVGSGVKTIYHIGIEFTYQCIDVQFIKLEERFKLSELTAKEFSFVIYRDTSTYGLPEITTASHTYGSIMANDLRLLKKVKQLKGCRRIVFLPIIRNPFNCPLIHDFRFTLFYLPYLNYASTRVCMFYDKFTCPFKKAVILSLSTVHSMCYRINRCRLKNPKIEMKLLDIALQYLVKMNDFLKIKPSILSKLGFIVGLFCLSNISNKREQILDYVNKCSKYDCLFNLPNNDIAGNLISQNESFKNNKLTTFNEGRLYTDHAFSPNEFWKYDVQIFPSIDIVCMGRFECDKKGKWSVREPFPQCNPSSHKFNVWFFVGNVLKDTRFQDMFNTQTQYMNVVSRLLRLSYGFQADAVYAIRSKIIKEKIPDSITMVSSAGTYITKDNQMYAVSGHIINFLIASKWFPSDLRRQVRVMYENMLGTEEYKNKLKLMKETGLITEADPNFKLWHKPLDFLYTVETANFILDKISTPLVDTNVAYKIMQPVLKLKSHESVNDTRILDITHFYK